MEIKNLMSIENVINELSCDIDLSLFNATTGETIPYWSLNGEAKSYYDAHASAIEYLKELLALKGSTL